MEVSSQEKQTTQCQKMFSDMYYCLEKSKTIQKHAIILIGQIRAGKSTTYNWLVHPQSLKGQYGEIQTKYILSKTDNTIAQIRQGYQSVTLIPNIQNLKVKDKQIASSLIDFPGFQENRTSVQMMLVNYVINTCFQHSTYVKFIIVVSDVQFRNTNGEGFINTLKQFVKLFQNLTVQERSKLFKSTSLLITSVQFTQYDSSKQSYLRALQKNLRQIEQLSLKNQQIQRYFSLIKELIDNIVKDQRLGLFQMAQHDQIARQSNLIDQLNNCGWEYFNLKLFCSRIVYPYEEYYKNLSELEQKNINRLIQRKVKQFQKMQYVISHQIIDDYLQNPFNRLYDLTRSLQNLQTLIKENRVHQDFKVKNFKQFTLSPIKNYQNIIALIEMTFQIKSNDEIQQNKGDDYFLYLKKVFQDSIDLVSQSFALKLEQKQIINAIKQIFSQLFQQLIYITKISQAVKNQCSHRLKQSIQIMNISNYRKDQVTFQYIKSLQNQDFESEEYTIQQLSSILVFLKSLDWKKYDLKDKAVLEAKILKAQAKLLLDNQLYSEANYKLTEAFTNALQSKLCLHYQSSLQIQEKVSHIFIENLIYQIMKSIYIASFCKKPEDSLKIFEKKELLFIIQQSFSNLEAYYNKIKKNQVYKLYEIYSSFFEKKQNYFLATDIYKKLASTPQIKKIKYRLAQIKQKIKQFSNKAKNKESQRVNDLQILTRAVNTINSQILESQALINISQMYDEITKFYKSKSEKIVKNQFDYEISLNPSNQEIMSVSESLIKKISRRKVTLIFGDKSGKTTAFYWLQKKKIIPRRTVRQYIYTMFDQNLDKMLHHKIGNTSLIPNICEYSQGELLIDFSRIFPNKLIHAIMQVSMLKLIIKHSQQVKFLLTIKEENLLSNQIIKLLKFVLKTFDWDNKDHSNNTSLSLLINYSSSKQTSMKYLNKFMDQFKQQYQNQKIFQEVYEINLEEQKLYQQYISQIINANRVILLPKASSAQLQIYDLKKYTQQTSWRYIQTQKIYQSQLFHSLYTFLNKTSQLDDIKDIISQSYKKGKSLMKKLGTILQKVIKRQYIDQKLFSQQPKEHVQRSFEEQQSSENQSQLFIFNQIFAFQCMMIFFSTISTQASSILQLKTNIIDMVKAIKAQVKPLKPLYRIQKQFQQLFPFLEEIDSFGCNLSFRDLLSQCCYQCNLLLKSMDLLGYKCPFRNELQNICSELQKKIKKMQKYAVQEELKKFRSILMNVSGRNIQKKKSLLLQKTRYVSEKYQNLSFRKQLSQVRCLYGFNEESNWIHKAHDLLYNSLIKIIEELNIQKLVIELKSFNMNPTKELLNLIKLQIKLIKKLKKQDSPHMKLKLKQHLTKCKIFTSNQKDYQNKLYCLIQLFQLTVSSQESLQIPQDKIQLIKIVNQMLLVIVDLDWQKQALKNCEIVHCDQIKCSIYNNLILNKQNKEQKFAFLSKYLTFLQSIGEEYLFFKLYSDYKNCFEWKERQTFQDIFRKLINKQLKWSSTKKTFYQNIQIIQIKELQNFVKKVSETLSKSNK